MTIRVHCSQDFCAVQYTFRNVRSLMSCALGLDSHGEFLLFSTITSLTLGPTQPAGQILVTIISSYHHTLWEGYHMLRENWATLCKTLYPSVGKLQGRRTVEQEETYRDLSSLYCTHSNRSHAVEGLMLKVLC